ncbi:unnamed protein product [Urochloa humidicola]
MLEFRACHRELKLENNLLDGSSAPCLSRHAVLAAQRALHEQDAIDSNSDKLSSEECSNGENDDSED